jgi:uncharacterized protein YdbL (DUF1318 family)
LRRDPDDEIVQHRRVALLELMQKHIRQRDLSDITESLAKLTAVQPLRQLRVGKFIQPVEGKRIRTGCAVIKLKSCSIGGSPCWS